MERFSSVRPSLLLSPLDRGPGPVGWYCARPQAEPKRRIDAPAARHLSSSSEEGTGEEGTECEILGSYLV